VSIWLFGYLLSGFYHAIVLSSVNPLNSLKNESLDNSNKFSIRNILVTFQFQISSVLIAGNMVVLTQINFMTNQEIGINVANKIAIDIPNYIGDNDKYWQLLKKYKQDLLKVNGVESVAIPSEVPGDEVQWTGGCRPVTTKEGSNNSIAISKLSLDKDYPTMYENKFLIERNFEKLSGTIYTIINKTAMLSMRFNSPKEAINKDIRLAIINTLKILVIIDFFHQTS
jgi:putative ABC transport system permease protein